MNGKGSKRRQMQITQEQFDKNWNRIFKHRPLTHKMLERIHRKLCAQGTDKCQLHFETQDI